MTDSTTGGIEALVSFGMEVIREAGEKALSYYGKGKQGLKFDESLVTEAEIEVNGIFADRLKSAYPRHRTLSEIHEDRDYSHEEKRYVWIFDPLDGVANFQAGIPIWGVSLALFENFWPLFGTFYMAATGDLFHARAGESALLNDRPISVSAQERINDESLLFTFSRFHGNYRTTFPGKIRNLGCTAAHICYVAMGRAEAAVIANESYQDLAAGWVIVRAAGGRIYRMDGTEFLLGDYLDGEQREEHLLVVPPEIHSQVRKHLRAG